MGEGGEARTKFKWGWILAIIGAVLVLADGAMVLAMGSFYGPHYGGQTLVGWSEIILGIIIIVIAPFYGKSPAGIGWSAFGLAIIALAFDGGFYEVGAIIALIGGVMIVYKR